MPTLSPSTRARPTSSALTTPTALRAAEWLALLPLGLMAGFFFAFAIDVAPAMTQLDASGYIGTQQAINRAVRHPAFGAAFFGSAALPWIVAALALWTGERVRALGWALVGLGYGAGVVGITAGINLPINEALAGWNPQQPPADWQAARDRWNEANNVRAWASALCFAAAAWLGTQASRSARGASSDRFLAADPSQRTSVAP